MLLHLCRSPRLLTLVLSLFIGLASHGSTVTAEEVVDRIRFGVPQSEESHSFSAELSQVIQGGLGESARQLLPTKERGWQGGKLKFTIKVDPDRLNYTTIQLWGDDVTHNRLTLWCEGKAIGYRHLGDIENIDLGSEEPFLSGHFYYRTQPLPLSLTRGKERLELELQVTGPVSVYTNRFEDYQKPMTQASRGIYSLTVSTDPFYVIPPDEPLGVLPQAKSPADSLDQQKSITDLIEVIKTRVNRECDKLLRRKEPLDQMHAQCLARAYHTAWTHAYQHPSVPTQIQRSCDEWVRRWQSEPDSIHHDPVTPNPGWFGVALIADALWMTLPTTDAQANLQTLDRERVQRWVDMFVASRNWLAQHRRQYTNQSMIIDLNIQRLDRAIGRLDSTRTFPDRRAIDYLYQSIGLKPWLGRELSDDLQVTKPEKPLGESYKLVTAKGLTRELGYVGSYGEVLDWVGQIYDSTRSAPNRDDGDAAIKKQLAKIAEARGYFRYPNIEPDGDIAMRLESAVGWRDDRYPGVITYLQRATRDASMLDTAERLGDARSVAWVQQAVQSGAFEESVREVLRENSLRATIGVMETPEEFAWLMKQPKSSARMPMDTTNGDFAWADEENGVVAIKKGNETIYFSLYWRARYGLNRLARVHQITPFTHRIATIECAVRSQSTHGHFRRPDDWTNFGFAHGGPRYPGKPLSAHGGEELPIAAIPADMPFKVGNEHPYAGFADMYQTQFGPWFVAMNTTDKLTFDISLPASAPSQAREWISGKVVSTRLPITLRPRSTIVLYLPDEKALVSAARPDLLSQLKTDMYGPLPAKPAEMQVSCVEEDATALSGLATRKQYEVVFRADGSGPKLQMLVYIPNSPDSRSVPVITSLNFWGNHTVHSDPKIQLTKNWIEQSANNPYCDLRGVKENRATDACRGTNAAMWPIEEMIRRGYAFSTIYRGDLVWDHPDNDLSGKMNDIFSLYPELQTDDCNFAGVGAWAWGLSRQLDVLESDPRIDSSHAVCFGWSRLGKASLWAGANDPRFKAVLVHHSGAGGAKLFRRGIGENIARLTEVFPHWFARNFRQWALCDEHLPWDQHELIRHIASDRWVCLGTATNDRNADPEGEYWSAVNAGMVEVDSKPQWPAAGTFGLSQRIGFFLNDESHTVTSEDWKQYFKFLDQAFAEP